MFLGSFDEGLYQLSMENAIKTLYYMIYCKVWEWLFAIVQHLKIRFRNEILINEVDILHKSDNYLIVNKHYDLVINSDDPLAKVTLQLQLRKRHPELVNTKLKHEFYFVHRLDYATSGIICIALHKKACSAASLAFAQHHTRKYYLALVRGHVAQELLDVREAVGECDSEREGNHRMCTASNPQCVAPRSAHTRMLVLQLGLYDCYPATKVLLRPITGRRHQLRLHCSHIGHTIVGDFTYSNRRDTAPQRMYLHAFRLVLPNSIETLCLQTADPFTQDKLHKRWLPVETLNCLDASVFSKLEV